jgi:hypothetical protein
MLPNMDAYSTALSIVIIVIIIIWGLFGLLVV